MSNFNLSEVKAIEQDVIAMLPEADEINPFYFKEPVAQYLYQCWYLDRSDMRLLIYCFPLIQSIMVKHVQMLKKLDLEENEIFNILCINLLTAFAKYNTMRGRLYTYCTLIMHFRIKDLRRNKHSLCDPLEDWDTPVDDTGFHQLADFKLFLVRLKEEQGATANRMLDAFLSLIECPVTLSLTQEQIHREISRRSGFPLLIVQPFYRSLIVRFEHSVLD